MTSPLKMVPPIDMCICGLRYEYCSIPFGHCHCGCGGLTNIAKASEPKHKRYNGMPTQFISQHHAQVKPIVIEAVPFKIDGVYCRLVPLTQGMYAIVDEQDYGWAMQWKWWTRKHVNGYYAVRQEYGYPHKGIGMADAIRERVTGIPTKDTDHKNRRSYDNRRDNLRPATRLQQACNRKGNKKNSTGFIGVYKIVGNYRSVKTGERKAYYISFLGHGKDKIFIGYSATDPEGLARLRDRKALELHGEFAVLNFPIEDYTNEHASSS